MSSTITYAKITRTTIAPDFNSVSLKHTDGEDHATLLAVGVQIHLPSREAVEAVKSVLEMALTVWSDKSNTK